MRHLEIEAQRLARLDAERQAQVVREREVLARQVRQEEINKGREMSVLAVNESTYNERIFK